ncbi:MAG: hypothetical protein ACTHJJ_08165 [Intrasporangium sp.]|uniref:hypothetical protein n=1 Tax=Intrasporangium sp. TaxID=1925024 RepID=UPI003F7EE15E
MSDIEHLLEEALRPSGPEPLEPPRDLFARVMDSVADDRRRRRHIRLVAAAWATGIIAAVVGIAVFTPRIHGRLAMDWWILEIATNLGLIAIAVWLGPFIKRFGRAYAADVFHDNPQTGKSYIVLTDIVYYLIFSAYILFTVQLVPEVSWATWVTAEQVANSLMRIGGILLVIAVLHGLNLLIMPVLGRLFSLNRRLPRH